VIQVPQPAEGGARDVDQDGDIYGRGDVSGRWDVSCGGNVCDRGESDSPADMAAQAETISRLKALDTESDLTMLPPLSGKNKRRSRTQGDSARARTQRCLLKKGGSWRYKDPLVRVGNTFMDLVSIEDTDSHYATLDRDYKHQFADVFADKLTLKLPPKGSPEHCICLKDGNKTTEGQLMCIPTKYYPAIKRFIEENVKAGRLRQSSSVMNVLS